MKNKPVIGVGILAIAGLLTMTFLTSGGEPFLAGILGSKNKKEPCVLTPKPREFNKTPYYTGPLIDTHVHMPAASKLVGMVAKRFGEDIPVMGEARLEPGYITCVFASEGIAKAIGFYLIPRFAEGQSVAMVRDIQKKYPDKIAAFFMPPPMPALTIPASRVENVLKKNPGLFRGYGEIALDRDTSGNVAPEDPKLMEIYKLAEKYNLIVMMHPRPRDKEAVERILEKFPTVTFLLHSGGDNWIAEIMPKHKNLYYSADNVFSLFGWERTHQFDPPDKEEWMSHFRTNFDPLMEQALAKWKSAIEANPDRFMWGTDRGAPRSGWTFEWEVGGLLEEFGRTFIARLRPDAQEKFAYQNVKRILERK